MKETLTLCHNRIQQFIHKTPVLSSRLINELVEADIVFKCENFQKMGAFKIRGASNAILKLNAKQKANGVVTHSSGNFAQALSLAAKNVGIKAFIVMPNTAPKVKIEAVENYGGIITFCEPTIESREKASKQIEETYGAKFIHPSNDMDVIIGNATVAKELLEEHPSLDYIISPVGGGGLIAGTALSTNYYSNNCKVIGGEPFAVDDAYRSLISGRIESNESTETIADGLRTQLGTKNFPIIQKYVDRIIRVEEEEIISGMKLILERLKIVAEPSSAVALAALIKEKPFFKNKKIGIIISGGNVDLERMPF